MASRTVIIHPGETVVLPSNIDITALILNGAISVSSTCANLPAPTAQVCYQMEWSVSETDNTTMDEGEGTITYIMIGGVQYDINLLSTDAGLGTAFLNIGAQIPGAFDVVSINYTDLSNRKDFTLVFRSIPDVAADIEMNMTGNGFPTAGLFVKPTESELCGDDEH